MMFCFYNTCLNSFNISSLSSGGIIISLTGFKILSAIIFTIKSPAARQNPVTRFLVILSYHLFLGYLGLKNGKTVTFHQKPFFKGSEW